jgi:hypothetical protein
MTRLFFLSTEQAIMSTNHKIFISFHSLSTCFWVYIGMPYQLRLNASDLYKVTHVIKSGIITRIPIIDLS